MITTQIHLLVTGQTLSGKRRIVRQYHSTVSGAPGQPTVVSACQLRDAFPQDFHTLFHLPGFLSYPYCLLFSSSHVCTAPKPASLQLSNWFYCNIAGSGCQSAELRFVGFPSRLFSSVSPHFSLRLQEIPYFFFLCSAYPRASSLFTWTTSSLK